VSTASGGQSTQGRVPQTVAKQVRPRKVWDIALSIVLLVCNYVAFLVGALFAVFSVAFIDYCPEPCSATDAAGSQATVGVVLASVALLATILTIVLLVVRRRAWWVPAASLLIIIVGWIVGFAFYAAALQGA
jgi:hypothetical protein